MQNHQTFAALFPKVNGCNIRIAQDLPHGQKCDITLQASVAETYIYIYNSEQAAKLLSSNDSENI